MNEIVNKNIRQYNRYAGDGLLPVAGGLPLPIGDPESGPYTPTAAGLREAILSVESSIDISALEYRIYESRTEAIADSVPASVHTIFLLRSGFSLAYFRDATGTALTTGDGAKWSPAGDITALHFNVLGDGVSDDTAGLQAFAAYFDAQRAASPQKAVIQAGKYLMTGNLSFFSNGGKRSSLDWSGATFVCDYDASGKEYFIEFGDPASPTTSTGSLEVSGRCFIERGPNCDFPPIAIYDNSDQSRIEGVELGSWPNTALHAHGVQNQSYPNWRLYSGGRSFPYLDVSANKYRQTGTTLARVSGSVDFPTNCVGKTIEIYSASGSRKGQIQARLSATQVTMDFSITDGVDKDVRFGSPAPVTNSGSPTVTLDGAVSADMVGQFIGIPRAGADGSILWATITAVNVGLKQITLNRNAGTSLNPVSTPLTSTTEIATPAIFIDSDKTSDGGVFSNGISQVRFPDLQIESFRGVGIGADDAEFVHFTPAKIHGISSPTSSTYALANIWANRLNGTFLGEFDSRAMGIYRMIFANQTLPFSFTSLTVRSRSGELLLRVQPMFTGYEGAKVSFDTLCMINTRSGETFDDLVVDANPSLTPGHVPPSRMFFPLLDQNINYLGIDVFADDNGRITSKRLTLTAIPTSSAGLTSGQVWSDAGTLKIVS